jgi:hypothetical protein
MSSINDDILKGIERRLKAVKWLIILPYKLDVTGSIPVSPTKHRK